MFRNIPSSVMQSRFSLLENCDATSRLRHIRVFPKTSCMAGLNTSSNLNLFIIGRASWKINKINRSYNKDTMGWHTYFMNSLEVKKEFSEHISVIYPGLKQ